MLTTIPFSGFYESQHDAEIDHAFHTLMYDHAGLITKVWDKINWSGVHQAYAKHYAESFADHFELKATFHSMRSPREYNFSTDSILMEIEVDEVKRILRECGWDAFAEKAKEKFTHHSGFVSFYSPYPESWGYVETWDANQVGCLIEAYVDKVADEDWQEYELMEDAHGNGYLDNWLYENCKDMNRWANLAQYIYDRSNR